MISPAGKTAGIYGISIGANFPRATIYLVLAAIVLSFTYEASSYNPTPGVSEKSQMASIAFSASIAEFDNNI